MKLTALLEAWGPAVIPDGNITGLHNDSRQIRPGDLFFAYPGAVADGRLCIQQAVNAGAAAVVYEPEALPALCALPNHIPCIPVPGLSHKLAAIASRFYDNPSHALSITGVTGTNGKTTIAWQLAQAYDLLGDKAAYLGTLGQGRVHALQPLANTTPDALNLQYLLHNYQKSGLQHVCMEVSSHALSQKRVENIDFNQAIYTNLSHEHLDYHHTMSAYAKAKAALFAINTLESAVINHDDKYADLMASHLSPTCQKLTYGLRTGGDVRALNWQCHMTGSQFEVASPWGKHQVHINTLGAFNVYNSLAIFTSLMAQDFSATDVVQVMAKLQAVPGRMEVVSQEPCVIVDYAHTPDALENVLAALVQLKQGRLGVVFGCGGDRDKAKRPMMGRIASEYADFAIITSDNPRTEDPAQIMDEIAQGLSPGFNALKIIDREQAIQESLNLAEKQDIILIAGKGHEAYQQIGQQRIDFSDQEVVRKLYHVQSGIKSPHL